MMNIYTYKKEGQMEGGVDGVVVSQKEVARFYAGG